MTWDLSICVQRLSHRFRSGEDDIARCGMSMTPKSVDWLR